MERTLVWTNAEEHWREWNHPHGFWVDGAPIEDDGVRPILWRQFLTGVPHGPLSDIAESIPDDIMATVREYTHIFPFELLALASLNPDKWRIWARRNGMLLLCVARELAHDKTATDARYYAELLNHTYTEVARRIRQPWQLGRIARKVPREMHALGYLLMLLTVVRKQDLGRLLLHCPRITLDVLAICMRCADQVRECPNLLNAAALDDTLTANITDDVVAVCQARDAAHMEPSWPWRWVPADSEIIHLWRARMEQAAIEQGAEWDAVYPLPPVQPTGWVWVSTLAQLKEFGKEWENCAVTLSTRLFTGVSCLFYEDTWAPGAVCVVIDQTGDNWALSEIWHPGNTAPSTVTHQRIKKAWEGYLKDL